MPSSDDLERLSVAPAADDEALKKKLLQTFSIAVCLSLDAYASFVDMTYYMGDTEGSGSGVSGQSLSFGPMDLVWEGIAGCVAALSFCLFAKCFKLYTLLRLALMVTAVGFLIRPHMLTPASAIVHRIRSGAASSWIQVSCYYLLIQLWHQSSAQVLLLMALLSKLLCCSFNRPYVSREYGYAKAAIVAYTVLGIVMIFAAFLSYFLKGRHAHDQQGIHEEAMASIDSSSGHRKVRYPGVHVIIMLAVVMMTSVIGNPVATDKFSSIFMTYVTTSNYYSVFYYVFHLASILSFMASVLLMLLLDEIGLLMCCAIALFVSSLFMMGYTLVTAIIGFFLYGLGSSPTLPLVFALLDQRCNSSLCLVGLLVAGSKSFLLWQAIDQPINMMTYLMVSSLVSLALLTASFFLHRR